MKLMRVQKKYVPRNRGEQMVPEIRLSGKWLQELGINPGSIIELSIENQGIKIKAIKNPSFQKQTAYQNI